MSDAPAALEALAGRVDELSRTADALEAAYRQAQVASEDVNVIVEQARKTTITVGDVQRAFAKDDRGQVAMLLHRLNNHLTGALSITSLAREDTKNNMLIEALDAMENAGRLAADAVRRLSEAMKRS
jgi:hypothetical protein